MIRWLPPSAWKTMPGTSSDFWKASQAGLLMRGPGRSSSVPTTASCSATGGTKGFTGSNGSIASSTATGALHA
jgi:hypothetical protein